jgi:inorganic pyrophosphatase
MQSKMRRITGLALFVALSLAPALARAVDWKDRLDQLVAPGYRLVPGDYAAGVPDTLVYVTDKRLNLYTDIGAVNGDGTINAVIEIPTGDNRKFETNVETGRLFWELKNGKPRTVAYLGYPTNYGMIPRTLGGDGDPLDVLTIGAMQLRGTVAKAKVVAVMRMIDGGDEDDKLIAVLPGTFFDGQSLADLEANGVTTILKAWFEGYKGPGEIQVTGFEGADAAAKVLAESMERYRATR